LEELEKEDKQKADYDQQLLKIAKFDVTPVDQPSHIDPTLEVTKYRQQKKIGILRLLVIVLIVLIH